MKHKHKFNQQGSTLTGFILGLVLGLAIAVAVAFVINKTPTPFTNKAASAKPDSPSQLQDPNKPLYSNKEAAKDAAKELANKPAADAKAEQKAESKPDAKTESKSDKASEQKSEKSAEKSSDKPADTAKSENTDDKYIYFLQVGAFKDQGAADNAKAKLALLGFEAKITERSNDNGTMYHVRLGPFTQVDAMNRMRGKLSENGVDVAIIRSTK